MLDPLLAESLFGEDLYQIPGKILIVLSKDWNSVSSDEHTQLAKILAALKLRLEAVQVITRDSITEELLHFNSAKIISFGVPFNPPLKPYENIRLEQAQAIYADSLDTLDDVKKRNLWLALKNMFGV